MIFNYILNSGAFDNLLFKCLYGYPNSEDKENLIKQIELREKRFPIDLEKENKIKNIEQDNINKNNYIERLLAENTELKRKLENIINFIKE